jgi:hypothetical protein
MGGGEGGHCREESRLGSGVSGVAQGDVVVGSSWSEDFNSGINTPLAIAYFILFLFLPQAETDGTVNATERNICGVLWQLNHGQFTWLLEPPIRISV